MGATDWDFDSPWDRPASDGEPRRPRFGTAYRRRPGGQEEAAPPGSPGVDAAVTTVLPVIPAPAPAPDDEAAAPELEAPATGMPATGRPAPDGPPADGPTEKAPSRADPAPAASADDTVVFPTRAAGRAARSRAIRGALSRRTAVRRALHRRTTTTGGAFAVVGAHRAPAAPEVADAATGAPTLHERMQAEPEFAELRRRQRLFVFPVTAAFLLWYLAYVLLASYARDLMAVRVTDGVNLGLVIGLLQFVSTFVISTVYVVYARHRLDPLAERLRRRVESGGDAAEEPAEDRLFGDARGTS